MKACMRGRRGTELVTDKREEMSEVICYRTSAKSGVTTLRRISAPQLPNLVDPDCLPQSATLFPKQASIFSAICMKFTISQILFGKIKLNNFKFTHHFFLLGFFKVNKLHRCTSLHDKMHLICCTVISPLQSSLYPFSFYSSIMQ